MRIALIQKSQQVQEDIIGSCELSIWEGILGNSEKQFQLIDIAQNAGTLKINFDLFLEEKMLLDGVLSVLPKQFKLNTMDLSMQQLSTQIKVIVNNKNAQQTQVSDQFLWNCLLYTSPSPRDRQKSRMPSSA
eukprot:TRINITY_DN15691_c0_g2_i1.p1 TRINITY_DN15691_c0_g2~~TRINITY_DN15691_c0_g2_i1.p1  ORF type:complete len:132 (-),score=24.57 TRINITY_DN15691_c0_g2_i1:12-407(-)